MSVLYRDFFTDSDGTSLPSHTPNPDAVGAWVNGNNGNWVISNENRARPGAPSLRNRVLFNQTPAINGYGVKGSYNIKSVDVDGGANDVHSGLISHGTTATPGRGMHLKLCSNNVNVNKVKVVFEWEGADVIVGQITGLTWGAAQTGDAKLEMIPPVSGNVWTVKSWITRTDGQYLKPDGSFQAGKIYWLDSTFDSTAMITNGTPMPMAGLAGFTSYANAGNSVGIHWDNFEIDDLIDTSLAVSPNTVAAGSTTTITLTGTGTTWTPGTPGSPGFTASSGTKNSQVVASTTSATINFTAPGAAGTVTITDPSTGSSAVLTITGGVIPGTLTALPNDGTKVLIRGTAPSGSGTVTRTLKRSLDPLFDPATQGTTIGTSTSGATIDWEDTTALADTPYFYKERYVDSNSVAANSNLVGSYKWQPAMTIGGIGDSLTQEGYFIDQVKRCFRYARGDRQMGAGYWTGLGGSQASDWISSESLLGPAITNLQAANVTDVFVMLGTNWEASPPNTAVYQSSMQNITSTLVAAGFKVWLWLPPYSTNEYLSSYVLAYKAVLQALDNGTTIRFLNDKHFLVTLGGYALGQTSLLRDGVHHEQTNGGRNAALAMYQAWDSMVYGDGTGSGGARRAFNGGAIQ